VAWGATGFGDLIWDTESGRPFGMSIVMLSRRDSRLDDDEDEVLLDECLDDELDLDEDLDDELDLDLEDFSSATSRMFRTRSVVGSVVEDTDGSWET